jgi:hypothetical protein
LSGPTTGVEADRDDFTAVRTGHLDLSIQRWVARIRLLWSI